MKKSLVFLSLLLVMVMPISNVIASALPTDTMIKSTITDQQISNFTLRYTYTSSIIASLSFGGSLAYCSGTVTPSGSDNVSITVRLYKQSGSRWIFVTSWSGSATSGHTAAAGGSVSVSSGTYKVTSYGVIGGGLEYPTASITKTK